jgi:hypothetical protein
MPNAVIATSRQSSPDRAEEGSANGQVGMDLVRWSRCAADFSGQAVAGARAARQDKPQFHVVAIDAAQAKYFTATAGAGAG